MSDRTKRWIADKMKDLMKKKSIDKIRVTEICKAAEIERPTFYYHFRDKYELVAWIFFDNAFKIDVISLDSATEAMNQMKKDYIFYKRAFEDSSQNPLWQYMVEFFVKRYTDELSAKLKINSLDAETAYSVRLYCYGAAGMTREWLLYDNITPARTVVEMMFASMPDSMKILLSEK